MRQSLHLTKRPLVGALASSGLVQRQDQPALSPSLLRAECIKPVRNAPVHQLTWRAVFPQNVPLGPSTTQKEDRSGRSSPQPGPGCCEMTSLQSSLKHCLFSKCLLSARPTPTPGPQCQGGNPGSAPSVSSVDKRLPDPKPGLCPLSLKGSPRTHFESKAKYVQR